MQNRNEAFIGAGGFLRFGPANLTIPYGAFGVLPSGIKDAGILDDPGIEITPNRSVTMKRGWPKGQVVRSLVTEADLTIKFTMLQWRNEDNKALFYGRPKNAVTGGWHFDVGAAGGNISLILDADDEAADTRTRFWFPDAEITEFEPLKIASAEFLAFGVTAVAYLSTIEGETGHYIEWTEPFPTEPEV